MRLASRRTDLAGHCSRPVSGQCGLFLATLALATIRIANAQPSPAPVTPAADSSVVQWARAHAVPLPAVDAPDNDSALAFLPSLVGAARIVELGEPVHGAHQPLAFRNKIIRYAVTHLGVTAIAIESGFTEAGIVDHYIQGGTGNLDSVVHAGITWQFDSLPENHALIQWLREYNSVHAAEKVRFYGLDVTGGNDAGMFPGAPGAVRAALAYAQQVAPAQATRLGAELPPKLDRFQPDHYAEYSAQEQQRLHAVLDTLYRTLVRDSSHAARVSSPREYARGLRNAWMAVRLNDLMAMGVGKPDGMSRAALALRDSTMVENVAWVLQQEGQTGRLFVYAHDGHVMNTREVFDSLPAIPLGYRLRARYSGNLVILAMMAGTVVGTVDNGGWIRGSKVVEGDPSSFASALAKVGVPVFALDVRTADHSPGVAEPLSSGWPFSLGSAAFPIIPRQAFDAVVYLDRVSPTTLK